MKAHLIADAGAAGCLKDARRDFGLRGEIFAVDDDLDVGPLREDASRDAWWKPIRDLYLDGLSSEMTSYGDQWSHIIGEVRSQAFTELVIWTSDSARDQTHFRLAASNLEWFKGKLCWIYVPSNKGLSGVSRYYPEELASFEKLSRPLESASRKELAHGYRESLAGSEGVRYQTDLGLEVRGYDCFDELLIEACPAEWTKTHKVIGLALSRCDGRNWVGDMFLRWRLKTLVDTGQIAARGKRWFVDNCDVLVRR
jgi:hypothetical protein